MNEIDIYIHKITNSDLYTIEMDATSSTVLLIKLNTGKIVMRVNNGAI